MVLEFTFIQPTFLPSALNKMPNTLTERRTDLPNVSRIFLTLEPRSRGISAVPQTVFSRSPTLTSQSHENNVDVIFVPT